MFTNEFFSIDIMLKVNKCNVYSRMITENYFDDIILLSM